MNTQTIVNMKETERVKLSKWQRFWHFFIVIVVCIVPALVSYDLIVNYFTGSYIHKSYPVIYFILGYSLLLLAIVLFFIQLRRLRFSRIPVSADVEKFHASVNATAKELNWEILEKTNNLIVAKSGFSWQSWGERITIVRKHDSILFNSICDPDNRPSIASWGRNKKNRKRFEVHLLKMLSNKQF